jgi:hypothetical protein
MLELYAITFLHPLVSMMYLMFILTQPEVRPVPSRYTIDNISELEIFIAMPQTLLLYGLLV